MTIRPWMVVLVFSWLFTNSVILAFVALTGSHVAPVNPTPSPSDIATAGHAWGVALAHAYADALDAGSKANDAGQPMGAITTTIESTWTAAHQAEFQAHLMPAYESIVPGGSEPTPAQRSALKIMFTQLAKGARDVK